MRPHSTGHTSITGRSHITMPPEWMPRCRGAFCSSAEQLTTAAGLVAPMLVLGFDLVGDQ